MERWGARSVHRGGDAVQAMSSRLWELSKAFDAALARCVDQETGELVDPAALEAAEMALEAKLINVALALKMARIEAEGIEAEAKRIADRAKTLRRREAWLEGYLAAHAPEGFAFSDARVVVSEVVTERLELRPGFRIEELPEEYVRRKPAPDPEIDKPAATKAIKSGRELPGLELVRARRGMRVK